MDMQPQDDSQDDTSQGFVIEISCLPDGTFNVSSESLPEEAQEEQGTGDADSEEPGDGGQTYKSFHDAMAAAIAIYKAGGQADDSESQFNSGFNPAQG